MKVYESPALANGSRLIIKTPGPAVLEKDGGKCYLVGPAMVFDIVDKDGEQADENGSIDAWERFATESFDRTDGTGQGHTFGPVRWNHDAEKPCGKIINYSPPAVSHREHRITATAEIYEPYATWAREGFSTGFSIGGSIWKRWCPRCHASMMGTRAVECKTCGKVAPVYTPEIVELSAVDSPAIGVGFDFVKGDRMNKSATRKRRLARIKAAIGMARDDSRRPATQKALSDIMDICDEYLNDPDADPEDVGDGLQAAARSAFGKRVNERDKGFFDRYDPGRGFSEDSGI
jgi:hypothetical protein